MLKWLIQRKIFISMLFTALTLLGIVSYRNLAVELLPETELPMLFVQIASQIESDPSYVEKQAIIPLEGAISTLEGIEEIHSFAEQRGGMIIIYFNQSANLKYAYLKLQEKVDAIKSTLPETFFTQVIKVDTEQMTNQFMSLEVRGTGGTDRIRRIVDEKISVPLENIDGIANVEIFGGRQKSVEIILDEDAAEAHGITPSQVRSAIRSSSSMRAFAGHAVDGRKRFFVNVTAEYHEITDLEQIVLKQDGPILLRDVAEIYFGVKEPESYSRVNGKEAVTVQLVRDSQSNLIDLSHTVQEIISDLNKQLEPVDIVIAVQSNIADNMEKNIKLIIELAITGGILAVFILWFFLRNPFLVIIIALAIPISIFSAMNFFYAAGVSLNSLTLVGIALAVGMLLDNSVVVLENIYRLASLKRDAVTAVLQGTKEVWRSIFAATATTIAVFLPFLFTSQFAIRLMGKHISTSIISTLLVSLFVALLLIPMITFQYFKRKQGDTRLIFARVSQKNRLVQIYTVLLKTAMRFPARMIIGALVMFFLSLIITLALSLNVAEETDDPAINLYVSMPAGSTLENTDLAVADLEKRLISLPEKKEVVSRIYAEEAILTVNVVENFRKVNGRSLDQIKSDIDDRTDDFRLAEVSFEQPQSSPRFRGGGGTNPGMGFERMLGIGSQTEKVVVIGEDFDAMRSVAEELQMHLESLTTMRSARLNVSDNRPEIHLEFDTRLMSQYNIGLTSVMNELGSFRSSFNSGSEFRQGTEIYDITIRSKTETEDDDADKSMDDLKTLDIPAGTAGVMPLSQLSDIIYASGLSNINRVNQEKRIEITYRFQDEVNSAKSFLEGARLEVDDLVASMRLPEGVAVEVIHDENDFTEFYYLIGAAFVLILMILASVFESFFLPFVILFSIPFAGIGSFWGLALTGHSIMNANTMMGLIILLGVVVNNSIILIDYTRILRQGGMRRSRALILAGQARLRPILITAITTVVGMIPLAMGKAQYVTQIGSPFAITVIGGLSVSTILTLVFIPTVYLGLETALAWIRSQHWKLKTVMLLSFISGLVFIQISIDAFLYKMILMLVLLIIIPGLTYFIKTSLRHSSTTLIADDEALSIRIRNMVKIYDRPGRFSREWNKGKIIRKHAGLDLPAVKLKELSALAWKLPFLGFMIYFVYMHIVSGFFMFLLSHLVYFLVLDIWGQIDAVLTLSSKVRKRKVIRWAVQHVRPFLYWGLPIFHLLLFQLRWNNPTPVAFIGILWGIVLAVYTTSNKLHRENINIGRITGRLSGLRRRFYRMVKVIPVIGKRKTPFRAVNRVSLDIGQGMFGLLGPNGAGKSTLMRIICGILEPSYGAISLNGIDLKENREELQGLIGYLPQEFGMYENMTAWEFLQYMARLKGMTQRSIRDERIQYVLKNVHMWDNRNEKIGSFSGGMKQRIGIAQILLHLPRILVVDEPTAGLDPRERIRFRNLLVELSRERIVIFSTHIIEDIASSCNRLAVLNEGVVKFVGEPVKMIQIAEGHVWQFHTPKDQFEKITDGLMVVHHMRDGDNIRVRALAEDSPYENAINVRPTLEDAYLWLLRGRKVAYTTKTNE
ncbi:efflux RND transporter permease subunit [bacterium]|nr:efflux RND transporter permease subunit [bacterium]